jgi:hypothetical protein
MKVNVKRVLTSVKIPEQMYEDFKLVTEMSKLSLQDVVERSMFLYITDSDYRMSLHQKYNTYYTGSSLVEELKRQ